MTNEAEKYSPQLIDTQNIKILLRNYKIYFVSTNSLSIGLGETEVYETLDS